MSQFVKNITSIKYFLERSELVDQEYNINYAYHPKAPEKSWHSLPTFVAEFIFALAILSFFVAPINIFTVLL